MQYTVNMKGKTIAFECSLTHREAYEALMELTGYAPTGTNSLYHANPGAPLARNSFACDLVLKGWSYKQTPRQLAWVHKLVVDATTPQPQPKAALDLPGIRKMLDAAGETLKNPKINLETECGQKVRLSVAGSGSKNPGRIHVTDGPPYGESIYFGYIDLDGKFVERGKRHDGVFELLSRMEADPAATASAYGRRTSCCAFCKRGLTTGESVAVGYGPICAEKFGLPWGEVRVSSKIEISKEEI